MGNRKVLNGLIAVLGIGLLVILLATDRGISGVMEDCGRFISNALGV